MDTHAAQPDDFPRVPLDLYQHLDRLFPEACPDPALNEREIWMRAGERRLVRFLRSRLDQQPTT